MPEPKDSKLPREERLFARVPKVTNEKIEFLAKRWGHGETLSTADVIIRLVEQTYLKAIEARTMSVPTEKKLLQRIKAGKEDRGILPVAPDESVGVGDILTFREATFSLHQIPTVVPNGDSVSMRITKAEDTGDKYGGSRLYAFRWQPVEAIGPKLARVMKPGDKGFCSKEAYYTSTPLRVAELEMETQLFVYPDAQVFNEPTGDATLPIERRPYGFVMEPPRKPVDRPCNQLDPCLPITNVATWQEAWRSS